MRPLSIRTRIFTLALTAHAQVRSFGRIENARYLARADDVGLAWLRAPILRAAQVLGQFAGSRDSARRPEAEFHDANGRS